MKKADTKLTVKKTAPKGKAVRDPNKRMEASAFYVFMETFRKQFKEENPTMNTVAAVGRAGGAKWKSMSESEKAPFVAEAEQRKTPGISLISNDAIVNVNFRPNLEPPAGLFLAKYVYENNCESVSYDFVPLDNRIPIPPTNFPFGPDVRILHSCNGLLLCYTSSLELYVYNPSIANMFKLIPDPDNVTYDKNSIITCFGLAFDPTKSHHYKVVYAEKVNDYIWDEVYQIHNFSSETGNWSLCGPQLSEYGLHFFGNGVYWNDAIYWRNGCNDGILKFDIMNECLVLTAFPTPLTLDSRVYYECRLFTSRGCLLLVAKGACSRHFTIYEKGNVYSEWSVKYIVNIDDIIKSFPESWSINKTLYCIVLEEREEDSFLVMKLDKKLVQCKIVSKTFSTISELGPKDDLGKCFKFIRSFANV